MIYFPAEVNEWTFEQYMRVLAKELDEHGFKPNGFESYTRMLNNLIEAKKFLGYTHNSSISIAQHMDYPAIKFAQEMGLVNSGRCPLCGAVATGAHEWAASNAPRRVLKICRGCVQTRGGGTGHGSGVERSTGLGRLLDRIIWGD
ncbi:MAG: hypothetical protein MJZ76_09625 [Bacteroidales bacterium]|nr:hypothetical protein [Bacteroidales bacterium]